MSDLDFEFEKELRTLMPATPSSRTFHAVSEALAVSRAPALRPVTEITLPSKPRRNFSFSWPNFGWALAGAGLAAVVLTATPSSFWKGNREGISAKPVATSFIPVSSDQEVLSAEAGDPLFDEEQGPSRLVRYSSVIRERWSNPSTGALLEVETPREDILLIPLAYQ